MNNIFRFGILCSFLFFLFLISCSSNSDYQSMVERGLQSDVRNDSLFLSYYFGMSNDDFYDESWQLNRQEMITGLVDVEYQLQDLKGPATMKFFPEFKNDVIVRMPVTIGYDAWAPWNEEFWPERLVEDLIVYYGEVYGAEFREVYVPEIERRVQVSIHGNREIRIYKNSETTVMVDFRDLNAFHDQ